MRSHSSYEARPVVSTGAAKKSRIVLRGITVAEGERFEVVWGDRCQPSPVQHVEFNSGHCQCVSVWPGDRSAGVAGHPSATGGVDDVDGDAQRLTQLRGNLSRDAVGAAARRPRADEHDWLGGKVGS